MQIKELRALSVAQPWAECNLNKGKNIENRSWSTNYRGYFALHASRSKSIERFAECEDSYGVRLDPADLDYGAVVAIACLDSVVNASQVTSRTSKWFEGEFGFVISDVIILKNPVRCKGALSFWRLTGAALKNVLSQLTIAQRKRIHQKLMERF